MWGHAGGRVFKGFLTLAFSNYVRCVFSGQVARKLAQAQRDLLAAEAAGASAEQAIHSHERHKKWLKF